MEKNTVLENIVSGKNHSMAELEDLLKETQATRSSLNFGLQKLLEESEASGGPSTIPDAITQALEICNLTVRSIAPKIKVSRRVIQDMLDGKRELQIDIVVKMYEVFAKIKPDVFDI